MDINVCCKESDLVRDMGKQGNVVHPYVVFSKDSVKIGNGNVFEELVQVGSNVAIGSNNYFQVGCIIQDHCTIGSGNVFQVKSIIEKDVGNNNRIGVNTKLTIPLDNDTSIVHVHEKMIVKKISKDIKLENAKEIELLKHAFSNTESKWYMGHFHPLHEAIDK